MGESAGLTGCFYVHVADLDAVAEELRGRVDTPWGVEDRAWGSRELVIKDPDGYYITSTAVASSQEAAQWTRPRSSARCSGRKLISTS